MVTVHRSLKKGTLHKAYFAERRVEGPCNMTDEKNSDVPAISDICNEVTKHVNGIAFSRSGTGGWAAPGSRTSAAEI
jgi:hypothetical protein